MYFIEFMLTEGHNLSLSVQNRLTDSKSRFILSSSWINSDWWKDAERSSAMPCSDYFLPSG